ncbi:hypothetical protein [Bdellovibrio sp. HCB337]|uniref:hypothetical protein n=1 Tax=Bdellovibrio sp. HCB337 TaxID=3394358 RepID=UPI0039A70E04
MKKIGTFLIASVILGSIAKADTETVYTCTPDKPTPLVSQVILVDGIGRTGTLTLVTVNADGQKSEVSESAEYYDDMTYFGYFSEKLDTAIEFYDFEDTTSAILRFGDQLLHMSCLEHVRPVDPN